MEAHFPPDSMDQRTTDIALVIFHLGDELYALPTAETREVVTYQRPRRLPGADPWVQGVINLRGEIIPVCDLAAALGLQQRCSNGRIVVCDSPRGGVGLSVDDVRAVMTIPRNEIEPIPSLDHPAMHGLFKLESELVVVLRADPIADGSARDVGAMLLTVGEHDSVAGSASEDAQPDEAPSTEPTHESEEDGRLAA